MAGTTKSIGAQGGAGSGGDSSPRFLLVGNVAGDSARQLLTRLDAGANVIHARSFSDVLQVSHESWSLVLVDHDAFGDSALHLPSQFPGCAVVALGGAGDDATMQKFLDCGFCGYLPRSYDSELMLSVLRLVRGGTRYLPHTGVRAPTAPPAAAPANIKQSLADYGLTPRQVEVLCLAAQGHTNLDIGNSLGIAEGTVKLHMRDVFRALNVENRSEAIILALRLENVNLQQMRSGETGKLDVTWLLPHMTHLHLTEGTILFHKDDVSDAAYYLGRGMVELAEIGVQLRSGDFFGEIGIFSPGQQRTCSARCTSDVELFKLDADKVKRIYYLNPQFAIYVVHLIAGRLRADQARQTISGTDQEQVSN